MNGRKITVNYDRHRLFGGLGNIWDRSKNNHKAWPLDRLRSFWQLFYWLLGTRIEICETEYDSRQGVVWLKLRDGEELLKSPYVILLDIG